MQKTIAVKNVEYSILGKPILKGVSFKCDVNDRLCIFGENGAGKSTLLKIICGIYEPENGLVEKQGHIRFEYVSQEFNQDFKDETLAHYIKEHVGDKLTERVFGLSRDLDFDLEKNQDKICGSLSGGQQKILVLSCAFAISPDFLLLDEPENHLDIVSRLALIELMEAFRGAIIFISHDRLLIDRVATKVGEVSAGNLHLSEGGYDDYIEAKMERLGGLQRQFDKEAKRIRQLSSTIVILKQKAIRGKEVSAYQRAKVELEELKKAHKEAGGRPEDKKTKINLAQTSKQLHNGKLLCRIEDGAFKYEDAKAFTFSKVNLEVRSGDNIVMLGRNGSGKSTFLKCLTGDLPLSAGEVVWADGIKWAYFDQHAEFNPEENAIESICSKLNFTDSDAQAALGAMRLDVGRMKTPTKNLSGGERMRVRFAMVFGQKPDFIILDEPTNHIDEVTWEILLEACTKSKSSILLVTHDYEFIKQFDPSVFWLIHNGKVAKRYKELDELLGEIR